MMHKYTLFTSIIKNYEQPAGNKIDKHSEMNWPQDKKNIWDFILKQYKEITHRIKQSQLTNFLLLFGRYKDVNGTNISIDFLL
jgi:nucleoside-specific outer membrane channel protein Tsx